MLVTLFIYRFTVAPYPISDRTTFTVFYNNNNILLTRCNTTSILHQTLCMLLGYYDYSNFQYRIHTFKIYNHEVYLCKTIANTFLC